MSREAVGSVTWVETRQKWRAQFGREYLGLFEREQEAWDVVNAWKDREHARGPETLRMFAAKWFKRRELEGGGFAYGLPMRAELLGSASNYWAAVIA